MTHATMVAISRAKEVCRDPLCSQWDSGDFSIRCLLVAVLGQDVCGRIPIWLAPGLVSFAHLRAWSMSVWRRRINLVESNWFIARELLESRRFHFSGVALWPSLANRIALPIYSDKQFPVAWALFAASRAKW